MKKIVSLAVTGVLAVGLASQTYAIEGYQYDGSETIALVYGSSAITKLYHLTTAADNSLYQLTSYSGRRSVDFDGGPGVDIHSSPGTYLTKHNADGSYGWTFRTAIMARSVAVDASGNIYITGNFSSTADFDHTNGSDVQSAAGRGDIYITKIDSNLNYAWTVTIGGEYNDIGYDIATNSQGDVFITGGFQDVVDFNFDAGTDYHTAQNSPLGYGPMRTYDLFLTKIDSNGSYNWTSVYSVNKNIHGARVALDSTNNIYVMSAVDLAYGSPDNVVMLQKYNTSGQQQWSGEINGSSTIGRDMVVTDDGIYLTGDFGHYTDFDPTSGQDYRSTTNSAFAARSAFVTKVSLDGSYGWTRTFDGNHEIRGYGIAATDNGDVVAAGAFRMDVDFDFGAGQDIRSSVAHYDSYYLHMTSQGEYRNVYTQGGPANDYAYAVTSDGQNTLYIGGQVNVKAYFGNRKHGPQDFDPGTGTDIHPVGIYGVGYFTRWEYASQPGPDLVPTTLNVPAQLGVNGQFAYDITVSNVGDMTSAYFMGTWWSIYLSDDATVTTADRKLVSGTHGDLASGDSFSYSGYHLLANDITAGNYTIGLIADRYDKVAESNENNNFLSFPVTIVDQDMDAYVYSLTGPGSLQQGTSVQWTARLRNGGTSTMHNVPVNFYLSQDQNITSNDIHLGETSTYLWPNYTKTVRLTTQVHAPAGQYYLGVIIDQDNTIYESNESNNVYTGSTVTVTPSGDLVVNDLSAPAQVSPGRWGEYSLTLTYTVVNQGGAVTGSASNDVYLSTDPDINASEDTFVGYSTTVISSLNPGESVTRSKSISLPSGTAPGNYYLGLITDANDNVYEGDENNNTYAVPIVVQ